MQVQLGMSSSILDRLSGSWYIFVLYEFMSTSTRPQLHVKMAKKEKNDMFNLIFFFFPSDVGHSSKAKENIG